MIIPQFWATGRLQDKVSGDQITLYRFGWSNTSQADAQANADTRVADAMRRAIAGEKLVRRNPKTAYNGADGAPIREEIISHYGDCIITRNAYGARCLNSPNALFADVDFPQPSAPTYGAAIFIALAFIALVAGWVTKSALLSIVLLLVALIAAGYVNRFIKHRTKPETNEAEVKAREKIVRFVSLNPGWNVRVYKTPAGLRALATHELFNPNDPAVSAFFKAIGTDRLYARMCAKQQCFRARLSPKPWRIGISDHLAARTDQWPISPEQAPLRDAWIVRYEAKATGYASCRLMESIGSGIVHPQLSDLVDLHDKLSQAKVKGKALA
jgi:hypothetical protein